MGKTEDGRPDPEELLRKIKRQEEAQIPSKRGKLKIFLGFSAGVGKTYAMLDAAHGLLENGIDVVAGYIEPHARPETRAMEEGIPAIPPLMVEYKGIELREFDLDAALERKPRLILVDELAHTNAPGLRHQKRYQDIEELLQAGINVFTTVNIQHLESLNDQVGSITNIRVRERIPDSVFDNADQVEVIDIEPDDLIERLKDGKIYKKGQAEKALDNFFAREKLIALREIALRRAADRVNRLSEKEREASGNTDYHTGEHVLTCISPSPTCAKVIRAASRLAYVFRGEFTALYVETPGLQNADAKTKKALDENIRLARALGADICTVFGEDIAYQIGEYAKVSNVSKIVIGRTNHKIYFGRVRKGGFSEKISQYVPNVDIYIIPDFSSSANTWQKNIRELARNEKAVDLSQTFFTSLLRIILAMGICTGVGYIFQMFHMAESNIIMVYLLGVIILSMYNKRKWCSVLSSLLSVIFFNFFFTEPYLSLNAYDTSYPVTFASMFVVGFLTSSLVRRVQVHASENAKQAHRTEILLENSRRLRRCKCAQDVVREVSGKILELMNLSVIFYLIKKDRMVGPQLIPKKGRNKEDLLEFTKQQERTVAQWVFKNGKRAGMCTHTLPMAKAIYLPIKDDMKVYGVVGIYLEEERPIPPFEYGLLTAMLNEAALVLARFLPMEEEAPGAGALREEKTKEKERCAEKKQEK